MTINEYLASLENLPHRTPDGKTMRETASDYTAIWSNDACRGYTIAAMKATGYNDKQINEVLRAMRWAFDETTVDRAEQIWLEF